MANTVIAIKKSATPAAVPGALANGELAINYADGKLFYKAANGTIAAITGSGGPSFGTVNANSTLLVAGIVNDVLAILPGENISIVGDYLNNILTISSSQKSVYDTANAAFAKANAGGGGGGANVSVGTTPPALPSDGNLWWNTDTGRLFIYYTDADSGQWVEATASGGTVNISSIVANVSPALSDFFNAAYVTANAAYVTGNSAYTKANSANVLAYNTGIGANAWANAVGTAGNNYTNQVGAAGNAYTVSVGASGNVYAEFTALAANNYSVSVGVAGNSYASIYISNTAVGANSWANTVATAGNSYASIYISNTAVGANAWTNSVASSVNAYASIYIANTAAGANAWTNSVASSINSYASIYISNTGIGANGWANSIGSAGNNYTNSVGAASNTWANSIGTAGNNYTNSVGLAGNNYTNFVGASANSFADATYLKLFGGTVSGNVVVTGNVNAHILSSSNGFVDLGPGSRPSYLEGRIYYDNVDKSLTVMNDTSDFPVPLGQKEFVRVWNSSGATISKGKPVYATGYHTTAHHHVTIALADASNANKYDVLGLVASDIADASHGYVIVRGWIGGIDTSSLTAGQRFHLGFASPGSLVTVAPEYPNYPYDIGYCVVSDPTNGYLYIDRQSHTLEGLRVVGTARVGGDMTVEGDFTVLGTQVVTSTSSLAVETQYIYLGVGDSIPNANITFTGTGLNDLSFKGHYEGTGTTNFWVKITGANVDGDYFSWSYDNFSTTETTNTLILYQTSQPLSNGISVYFQANTGHTTGATWNASATAVSVDAGFVTNHTDPGKYTHAGLFRDATDGTFKFFNTYDAEPAGNIDISNNTFSLGNVQVRKVTADLIYAGSTEIGGLIPSISDKANSAYDKANSANVLAYNTGIGANAWANTVGTAGNNYTISVGASANNWANTKLSNGTATLVGSLTTTGDITSNGYVTILPSSSGEGGELKLQGEGSNTSWSLDAYQNNVRMFARTGTTVSNVNFFHSVSGGTIRMGVNRTDPTYTVDVNGTVNAASFLVNGVALSSGSTSSNSSIDTVVTANVFNTTTETNILSYDVPISPSTNTAYRFEIDGTYLNNSGANRTIRFLFKLGATTIFDSGVSGNLGASAVRRRFKISGVLSITGASSQYLFVEGAMGPLTNWGNDTPFRGDGTAAESLSTTKALTVSVIHNLAATTVSLDPEIKIVEELK